MKIKSRFSSIGTVVVAMVIAVAFHAAGVGSDYASAESFLKDLDIRQMPMAKIQPAKPSAASAASRLSVSASVDRANRKYKHGDNVVLTVKPTEDAYIWVFDTGTSGKVHQIFPNRYAKNNFVKANAVLRIPGNGAKYMLTASRPKGAELITVIASKTNASLTAEMMPKSNGGSPFLALNGTAQSVAKDLSITLRKKHRVWAKAQQVFLID
ncbi:MAG: DUF4384 domain-containing protein [Gammaproteobacteria bacterium]|nr:DUF4384 domain-containing protein [Gammaproteobacteria bacterium]